MYIVDDNGKRHNLTDEDCETIGNALQDALKENEKAFSNIQNIGANRLSDRTPYTEKDFGIPDLKRFIAIFQGE